MSRSQRLIEKAIKELRQKDWRRRRRAMNTLILLAEKSVPSLIALLDDPGLTVRLSAAEALEMIGPPALPALLETLEQGSPLARRHAAGTLGQIRDQGVAGPLVAALRDGDTELRRACALALGSLRALDGIPALVDCLAHEDPTVRGNAADALGRISQEGDVSEAVPQLAARLNDFATYLSSERRVCHAAADALKRIGTEEALAALAASGNG